MKKKHIVLTCIIWLFPFFMNATNDGSRYAPASALSQGKWVQIKTTENAVYKLTYEDIKGMGFADPAKIKIHGYGGWILPEDFTQPYIDDLPEVSVWMNKGGDGVFGAGDYLLFYGRGTVKWDYDPASDIYQHENNPYALYGTYFIGESEEGPKEMTVKTESLSGNPISLTVFNDYYVHEKDEFYVLESGRELFGESFAQTRSQNFNVTLPGITSDDGKGKLHFIAAPNASSSVSLSLDGTEIGRGSLRPPGSAKADSVAVVKTWSGAKKEAFTVNIAYNGDGRAFLNYFLLNYNRKLQNYNEPYTLFRHKDHRTNDVQYEIDGATSGLLVWDITGNYDARLVDGTLSGSKYSFKAASGEGIIKEYVLVNLASGSFPTPTYIKDIENQNLHALEQHDMIIISPQAYYSHAEKLADAHREEGLTVFTALPEWIYNEFSSGTQDATAYRRFMKMFYDRAETEAEKPRYLLLYGDGIFDNRFITDTGKKMNPALYLLTYQYRNSLSESASPGTDDYFGFLDDNEGTNLYKDVLDLGIGRFPVSTTEQAANAANKVIKYMKNENTGEWKNKILLAADNSDNDTSKVGHGYCLHAHDIDTFGEMMEKEHPEYLIYKSYMDAYKPLDVNGQTTIPGAKEKFMNTMKEGCFVMTYLGHGSPRALSSEDMVKITDIRQMQYENLPLWITGTCDFAWFDRFETSAGEEVFLNKNSAGIALFSTSRVVYSSDNRSLINYFYKYMFDRDEESKYYRLGDIMRYAKNNQKDGVQNNKLNYVLLGDPALKLNYPEYKVILEKVNDVAIDELDKEGNPLVFNFPALATVELEGYITDEMGNPVTDFNGSVRTTVFDSKQTIKSYFANVHGEHFTFTDYPNRVFVGTSTIDGGRFKASFMVPLDISYTEDLGKLNFYAVSDNGIEANGWYKNFVFAGSSTEPPSGMDGPEVVEMFLNDPSFKDGDEVNATPYFVATVRDEHGINMAGTGLGHDITISINNSPSTTYSLNSNYYPQDDGSGVIRYSIPALPDGEHSLVFTVWNILNEFTTDSLHFVVNGKKEPEIYDLIAANTPARDFVKFLLQHNRPESQMQVEIYVYNLTGQTVWYHKEAGSSGWHRNYSVDWDLTDSRNNRIKPGVYVYKAIISAPEGKTATKAKKITVLGQ